MELLNINSSKISNIRVTPHVFDVIKGWIKILLIHILAK